jgi:putative CocE/NonD family hydrolase
MSLASGVLARRMRLHRPQTADVVCERDLRVPMDDGAVLLADRWVARATRERAQPTVLVRSPYGRRGALGVIFGRLAAERGLQVLIQSVRGTFGSEGRFSPFDERADGLATLRWIREQAWHRERIGMLGPSYLGLVQWAVAADGGEDLAALAIQVSASQFHGQTYAGGSFSLETAAQWLVLVAGQERRLAPVTIIRALRRLPDMLAQFPLAEIDALATGAEVAWFREGLASTQRQDPYWAARDYADGVGEVSARVQLIGGWYDIFLPWMLEDFSRLQAAGRDTQLIVGPWTHAAPELLAAALREGLGWLRAGLLGDERLVRAPAVRIRLTGEPAGDRWREFPRWPPPGTSERRWWLAGGGRLQQSEPGSGAEGSDRYRYDPAEPTPSVGGPGLLARLPVQDNRSLEARRDVLTYTSEPLPAPLEAIGPVRVELWARASSPYFDLFARVCDVDATGASWNVCDALQRVYPGLFEQTGESWRVAFELWPMAHRFAGGHRIRLQVSSGAHPRYGRNPGTGEDPATATTLRAVDIEILHGRRHPAALLLPAGEAAAGPDAAAGGDAGAAATGSAGSAPG